MSSSATEAAATNYSQALAKAEERIGELTLALALAQTVGQPPQLAVANALVCIADENPNPIVCIGANQQQLYANQAAQKLGASLARPEQVRVQRQLRAGADRKSVV